MPTAPRLILERESDASKADENVTLGLGEGAVYVRNTAGTCREFLSSQQSLVDDMIILEPVLYVPIAEPLWNQGPITDDADMREALSAAIAASIP